MQKYHTNLALDRIVLTFEAQTINPLLGEEIIEIGYMSLSRWEKIAETFVKAGELSGNYSIDGFLFKVDEPLPQWVLLTLLVNIILYSHRFTCDFVYNPT